MATNSSLTLFPSNTADADFRAWASFIHATLTLAGGWVDNADTGSINLATVTHPLVNNTSAGFKVYRMNDALQATAPVFVKVEFGSAGGTDRSSVWITVGTGSNGSGTITGIVFPRTQIGNDASSAVVASRCYGSVGTARGMIAMFLDFSGSSPFCFAIERSVDNTGANTSEGVFVTWFSRAGGGTPVVRSQYCFLSGTPVPPAEYGFHIVLGSQNPTAIGADIGVSSIIPIAGIAKQPPMNGMVVLTGDFAAYATIAVTIYGASHTYLQLGPNINTIRNGGFNATSDGNTRLCYRYE